MKKVISYITLAVTDLKKMKQFYDALDFEVFKQSDDEDHPYIMYKVGAIVLALYPKALLAKQSGCSETEFDNKSAISLSLNVENKTDVDALLTIVKEQNATVKRAGFEPAWGGYCAYFNDPENNLWEVVWHKNFKFEV